MHETLLDLIQALEIARDPEKLEWTPFTDGAVKATAKWKTDVSLKPGTQVWKEKKCTVVLKLLPDLCVELTLMGTDGRPFLIVSTSQLRARTEPSHPKGPSALSAIADQIEALYTSKSGVIQEIEEATRNVLFQGDGNVTPKEESAPGAGHES